MNGWDWHPLINSGLAWPMLLGLWYVFIRVSKKKVG